MELLRDVGVGLIIVVPVIAGFAFVPGFMTILWIVATTLIVSGVIGNLIRG